MTAPDSYFEDQDDDSLVFDSSHEAIDQAEEDGEGIENETEEVATSVEEDVEDETPAFLLDDDGPEDDIKPEDEILEDMTPPPTIKKNKSEAEAQTELFDDEDGGMFFSR
jgi:hypothetical protein